MHNAVASRVDEDDGEDDDDVDDKGHRRKRFIAGNVRFRPGQKPIEVSGMIPDCHSSMSHSMPSNWTRTHPAEMGTVTSPGHRAVESINLSLLHVPFRLQSHNTAPDLNILQVDTFFARTDGPLSGVQRGR